MERLRVPRVSLSTPTSPESKHRRSGGPDGKPAPTQSRSFDDGGATPVAAVGANVEKLSLKSGPLSEHTMAREPQQNVIMTTFVIPSSFFKDFNECIQSDTTAQLKSTTAQQSDASIVSWRRMMQSPLGVFLAGVRNKYPWIQLAGHKGNFIAGQSGTICKKASDLERCALEELMSDHLKPFVPLFYKEILIPETPGAPPEPYLEIQDLLGNFQNPSVMDVKMGVRTFLESEVTKSSKRMDLLQKMVELDPDEPTDDERKSGITKLRYMSFRERLSSTKTMSFRIEGIKLANQECCTDFKTMKNREEVAEVLLTFFPPTSEPLHNLVRTRFTQRLVELHEACLRSQFFWCHELIGSSLLFIYDHTGRVGVWMIDFGKTSRIETGITHREPWILGNREDGYLNGLENLIDLLQP